MSYEHETVVWNKNRMPKGGARRTIEAIALKLGIEGVVVHSPQGNPGDGNIEYRVPVEVGVEKREALRRAVEDMFTAR